MDLSRVSLSMNSYNHSAILQELDEYDSIIVMKENWLNIPEIRNRTQASQDPKYYHRLADSYFLEKKYSIAAEYYIQSLLKMEKYDQDIYQGWGHNQLKKAAYHHIPYQWYERAIKQNHRIEHPLNALSICLTEISDQQSLEKIEEKLNNLQENSPINCIKGHFYFNQGKLDKAQLYYQNSKDKSYSLVGLAEIWRAKKKNQQAKKLYQQAIQSQENNSAFLGLVQVEKNQKKKIDYIHKLGFSGIAKAHLIYGKLLYKQKNYQKALQQFIQVGACNQFYDDYQKWIGKTFLKLNSNVPIRSTQNIGSGYNTSKSIGLTMQSSDIPHVQCQIGDKNIQGILKQFDQKFDTSKHNQSNHEIKSFLIDKLPQKFNIYKQQTIKANHEKDEAQNRLKQIKSQNLRLQNNIIQRDKQLQIKQLQNQKLRKLISPQKLQQLDFSYKKSQHLGVIEQINEDKKRILKLQGDIRLLFGQQTQVLAYVSSLQEQNSQKQKKMQELKCEIKILCQQFNQMLKFCPQPGQQNKGSLQNFDEMRKQIQRKNQEIRQLEKKIQILKQKYEQSHCTEEKKEQ